MYLRGRPAEGLWGSSRQLFVGHLYLAYVLVGRAAEGHWGLYVGHLYLAFVSVI